MDVAAWLQGLGLERYAPAFLENRIEADILPSLTLEDLRDLGVTLVGDRRRLLDAIAALGVAISTPAASAPAVTAAAPAPADAERRQLTVMFCDLVGSTALSTRHDPEDLRELIDDYHRAVSETVGRFDGFVAKYMGDGVLIYFGYPQAHEDDAERAVRAGLAVIEAVGRLPARQHLSVRLGIATGLAVVGDLIGEGAAQERGVVGETPNLAARLQGLAAPNTLIVGEATRRQVGGLFDVADLGPQALAGFAEPQPAWRVIGESGMLSRFEALRSGETPLVGRDEEVELLVRRWHQAKSGEGRVVLISGEPGIGKSRLTAALSEHIGSEAHTRLRYFCSPHHQDSALYPFIAQLERVAGFARDDTVEAKLGKLRALLAPGTRDDDDIALLSELLSLPSSAANLNLSPQRKREKLFEALLNQLEAEARRRPVLMVFEDAHWIDPTSRELLDLTVDRVRRLPVLLVITFRPEFQSPWGGRAVDQWLKAGQHAAARLAYLEAIAHLERVLGLLHSLPESPVRNGREIELQLALGLSVFTAKGAVEAKLPYMRAHELAERSGEPQQRFEALYGVWPIAVRIAVVIAKIIRTFIGAAVSRIVDGAGWASVLAGVGCLAMSLTPSAANSATTPANREGGAGHVSGLRRIGAAVNRLSAPSSAKQRHYGWPLKGRTH